jgi:hypothetical protein
LERMQPTRFLALTGHLRDCPLPELIGTLRRQRKTGRLLVEYEPTPGTFYFKEGELVDARLNTLVGLQAVCVALAQPAAAFNFNPLVQPPMRSIDASLQRVVSELCGCWEESPLELVTRQKSDPGSLPPSAPALSLVSSSGESSLQAVTRPEMPEAQTRLALPSARRAYHRRTVVACVIGLMLIDALGVFLGANWLSKRRMDKMAVAASPGLAVPQPLSSPPPSDSTAATTADESDVSRQKKQLEPVRSEATRPSQEPSREQPGRRGPQKDSEGISLPKNARPRVSASREAEDAEKISRSPAHGSAAGDKTITVVVQLDHGHVSQAAVADRKPGMAAYEALALRIARQRRYPASAGGQEKVLIRVSPSN